MRFLKSADDIHVSSPHSNFVTLCGIVLPPLGCPERDFIIEVSRTQITCKRCIEVINWCLALMGARIHHEIRG